MSEERDRVLALVSERKSRFERELLRARLSTPGGLDVATVEHAEQVLADFDRLSARAATIDEPNGADAGEVKAAANELARMRAYVLPMAEVRQEASALVTTMEDWGVPRDVLGRWRRDLELLPRTPDADARAILRTIIWDTDYWSENIEALFELRKQFAHRITPAVAVAAALGGLSLLNGFALVGFLCAAAAGAGTSLLRRPPPLGVYRRVADIWPRATTRWFTGIIAAVLALGLLQAGLVTIPLPHGRDLMSLFSACSVGSCALPDALVVFASAFTLGYTEHVIPSLGDSLLGSIKGKARRDARSSGPGARSSPSAPG